MAELADILGCKIGRLPMTYLGMPLGASCCKIGRLPMTYLGMPLGASFKAKSVCNSIFEKVESIVD